MEFGGEMTKRFQTTEAKFVSYRPIGHDVLDLLS